MLWLHVWPLMMRASTHRLLSFCPSRKHSVGWLQAARAAGPAERRAMAPGRARRRSWLRTCKQRVGDQAPLARQTVHWAYAFRRSCSCAGALGWSMLLCSGVGMRSHFPSARIGARIARRTAPVGQWLLGRPTGAGTILPRASRRTGQRRRALLPSLRADAREPESMFLNRRRLSP